MNRRLVCLLLAFACLSAIAQNSRPEITNADVASMTKSGLSEQTIILAIQQGPTAFDTSPQALIVLKKAGVADAVLDAMLSISKSQHTVAEGTPTREGAGGHSDVGYINCGSLRVSGLPLWGGRPGEVIDGAGVHCGEQIRVLERDQAWNKVQTATGKVGYLKAEDVSQTPTMPGYIPPVSYEDEHPADVTPTAASAATKSSTQLRIRVLEEKSIPYTQQAGGGISTSCSISGSANTSLTATTTGNFTFGNATTTSGVQMHCSSYDTTVRWPHVLNAMLVEASDGNAYIIACDRAWRWSKCVPLRAGETFNARHTSKGIAVQAFNAKGQESEPTYTVLQSKALH